MTKEKDKHMFSLKLETFYYMTRIEVFGYFGILDSLQNSTFNGRCVGRYNSIRRMECIPKRINKNKPHFALVKEEAREKEGEEKFQKGRRGRLWEEQ